MTSPAPLEYRLWIASRADGQITLNGWTETPTGRTEHWPPYPLCHTHDELSERLSELGLVLAPAADLTDLDHRWDVYLHHNDPTQLRAHLDAAA